MSNRLPLLLATAALVGLAGAAHAVPAIGLAGGNSLFRFDTAAPGTVGAALTISGLGANDTLLGLDYRPATGVLYAIGSASTLYTINTTTGAATLASTLSTPLAAGGVDISFNPTVDRLRIVGTSGQDLRVNVDTGAATVDGALAYAAGDTNAGRTPSVVAAAYTNQVAGTVATTTLYDLDSATNALVTQAPPNNGTLNTIGTLSTTGLISLDIDGTTNTAYAATSSALYRLDLTTGLATALGNFGTAAVTDIALIPTPEPMSLALLGTGLAALTLLRRRT